MTTKYTLTHAQVRAALATESPGMIVEEEDGVQWRRPTIEWALERRASRVSKWEKANYGPDACTTYRIIRKDDPDHPDYVAPEPAYKLLTAEEALALGAYWYLCPYYSGPQWTGNEGGLPWSMQEIAFAHLAQYKGWPIVATLEEAQAILKEPTQ